MVRYLDRKKRHDEILDLIIKEYIQEGKPLSSGYLKDRFALPFSSATLRNTMAELEDLGYLHHLHASSGRVPTQKGFRYYVNFLMEKEDLEKDLISFFNKVIKPRRSIDELLDEASHAIAELTHYAGLSLHEANRDRLFFWGARYILEQPEFEDIDMLRNIFSVFEEDTSSLWDFLEDKKIEENIQVFIGNEISLKNINKCSLVLSPLYLYEEEKAFLGVLGPIRMNYNLVISNLEYLKNYLEEELID